MRHRRTSKTSKRRTSRSPRRNARDVVQGTSPLDYTPTGYPKGVVQRLALVDTEAPPPPKYDAYFVEEVRMVTRGKGGRELKRPRKVVTPGAPPNTVAFIDYYVSGRPGDYNVYINYMKTRRDMQGKGVGKALLLAFMDGAERSGVTFVNFGKIMSPAAWKLYEEYRKLYEGGASKIMVHGKRDF